MNGTPRKVTRTAPGNAIMAVPPGHLGPSPSHSLSPMLDIELLGLIYGFSSWLWSVSFSFLLLSFGMGKFNLCHCTLKVHYLFKFATGVLS